jgi:hypothetical protein
MTTTTTQPQKATPQKATQWLKAHGNHWGSCNDCHTRLALPKSKPLPPDSPWPCDFCDVPTP